MGTMVSSVDGEMPPNWVPGASNYSGAVVDDRTPLLLHAVHARVPLVADSIASLRWSNYRERHDFPERVSPTPTLLRKPSPWHTDFDFKHQLVTSLAVRGNFYGLVVERDRLEYPQRILPLHPDWVCLERDPMTWALITRVMGERIPNADLFHIPYMRMPGNDYGLSPVSVFAQSIGLGLAAEQYGAKWFRDGAAPSSVLETEANLE